VIEPAKGPVASGQRHRFGAVGGEQATLDPRLLLEQRGEADPAGRVRVDDDRPDRGVRQRVGNRRRQLEFGGRHRQFLSGGSIVFSYLVGQL